MHMKYIKSGNLFEMLFSIKTYKGEFISMYALAFGI